MLAWLIDIVVLAGMVSIFAGMLLCIARLVSGPQLADRALAVDTLAIQLIGFVILLMLRNGNSDFIDGILVLSLIGFAGTVAVAQYIIRGHLRKGGDHE